MTNQIKRKSLKIQEIVDWLRQQTDSWWAIDGDWRLQSHVEMPASNNALADALQQYCDPDETLQVLAPDSATQGVGELMRGDMGRRQLTADGGDDGDGWILVEQTDWVEDADAEIVSPSTDAE